MICASEFQLHFYVNCEDTILSHLKTMIESDRSFPLNVYENQMARCNMEHL